MTETQIFIGKHRDALFEVYCIAVAVLWSVITRGFGLKGGLSNTGRPTR